MNYKRAIGIGILYYVLSFVIGTIIATAMGIDLTQAETVSDSVWYIGMLFTIVLGIGAAYWYFQGEGIKASARDGAYLGIVFILVGTVLDLIVIIPWILTSGAAADILAYYMDWKFWATLVLIVLSTAGTGEMLSRKK